MEPTVTPIESEALNTFGGPGIVADWNLDAITNGIAVPDLRTSDTLTFSMDCLRATYIIAGTSVDAPGFWSVSLVSAGKDREPSGFLQFCRTSGFRPKYLAAGKVRAPSGVLYRVNQHEMSFNSVRLIPELKRHCSSGISHEEGFARVIQGALDIIRDSDSSKMPVRRDSIRVGLLDFDESSAVPDEAIDRLIRIIREIDATRTSVAHIPAAPSPGATPSNPASVMYARGAITPSPVAALDATPPMRLGSKTMGEAAEDAYPRREANRVGDADERILPLDGEAIRNLLLQRLPESTITDKELADLIRLLEEIKTSRSERSPLPPTAPPTAGGVSAPASNL